MEPTLKSDATSGPSQAVESDLICALRLRLGNDLPVGRLLNDLSARLRSSLTGGSSDATVLRLLNELAEHAFRPGTNGYVLRDLVMRSGLGFEGALARASDYMLEGDLQPPAARTLAAAWVQALGGESVIRPAAARKLEELLVRELHAIRDAGQNNLATVMQRLGQVILSVLMGRSTVILRDSALARADALVNSGEFPEREVALLRVWLGLPAGVSERVVTLWLAQAVLRPWLRDLKACLLRAEKQLEKGEARAAVQRALAGLEAEQLLNLARALNGEGWLASFPIPDGDGRGAWTTAHLLHRSGSDDPAQAEDIPTQSFVLGVEFTQLGPLRAEFRVQGTAITLRLVVDRSETAGVLRRRLVELHSLFEGADAQVQLSVVQGSAGDASVESLLRDVQYLRDHRLLGFSDGQADDGQPAVDASTEETERKARAEQALAQHVAALRYRAESGAAPNTRGSGTATDRMIALARKESLPLREDVGLLALLATSEIGEEIPVELYEVAARLLTYLHQLKGEVGAGPR